MKTINPLKLALVGLFGALAFNTSFWWGATEMGSSSFASKYDDREDAIEELKNCLKSKIPKASIGETVSCTFEYDGEEVTHTVVVKEENIIKKGKAKKSGSGSFADEATGATPKENSQVSQEAEEAIKTLILERRTESTSSHCGDEDKCGKITISSDDQKYELGPKGKLKEFNPDKDHLASKLVKNAKNVLDAIDKERKKARKKYTKKRKAEKKYKSCSMVGKRKIRIGSRKFEECFEEQLSNDDITLSELAKLINKKVFPYIMNKAFSKDEDDQEEVENYLEMIAAATDCELNSKGYLKSCDSKRDKFLGGTYNNFVNFQKDFKKRNLVMDEYYRRLKLNNPFMDQKTLDDQMALFEQSYANRYVKNRMSHEISRSPAHFHDQYNLIGNVLETGKAPMRSRYGDFNRTYTSGNGFSKDSAWRALGLDDNDSGDIAQMIRELHPHYDISNRSATANRRTRSSVINANRKLEELDKQMRNARKKRN